MLYTTGSDGRLSAAMRPFLAGPLPPAHLAWEPLIGAIGRANRALARYDGVLHSVPGPLVLLAPLTTEEAVLSSKIEGTQATLGDVLKFEAGEEPEQEARRADINEILNYRKALRTAESELKRRPFSASMLCGLHAILLDGVRGHDRAKGRFRKTQNWIGPEGAPIEQAVFVPPEPTTVQGHMDAWEAYYRSTERDPLVQLAIVHAQFEIIHPFDDGNGRMGRILVPIFLFEKQLLQRPMFYLSAWLDAHRDEYVAGLRALGPDADAWTRWCAFFLRGIEEQSAVNEAKARAILELYSRLKSRVLELTHSQFAVPLLDQMFQRPIFQSQHLKFRPQEPSRPAVANLLRKLRDDGILKPLRESAGRRGAVYVFPELLNLCEGKTVF